MNIPPVSKHVIPAKAGIQQPELVESMNSWIPVCTGMTVAAGMCRGY